ncbi:hypothetical protein Bbelb_280840, partial [Branchiostoma belcheri]
RQSHVVDCVGFNSPTDDLNWRSRSSRATSRSWQTEESHKSGLANWREPQVGLGKLKRATSRAWQTVESHKEPQVGPGKLKRATSRSWQTEESHKSVLANCREPQVGPGKLKRATSRSWQTVESHKSVLANCREPQVGPGKLKRATSRSWQTEESHKEPQVGPGKLERATSRSWQTQESHKSVLANSREPQVGPGKLERATSRSWQTEESHKSVLTNWREPQVGPGKLERATSRSWQTEESHKSVLANCREPQVGPGKLKRATSRSWQTEESHKSGLANWREPQVGLGKLKRATSRSWQTQESHKEPQVGPDKLERATSRVWQTEESHKSVLANSREPQVGPGKLERATSRSWQTEESHKSVLTNWREPQVGPGKLERATSRSWQTGESHKEPQVGPDKLERATSRAWQTEESHKSVLTNWREPQVGSGKLERATSRSWQTGESHKSGLANWREPQVGPGKLKRATSVRDNRGTEFILTFTENFQRDRNPPRLFITTQSATTDVTVTLPATGYTTTVTATNGQASLFSTETPMAIVTDVALDRTAVELRGSQKSDKAIHVTSDEEIVIYGVFAEHASSDAYLALPTDVLGTEYFAACATVRRSWAEEGFTDLPSEFGVVGVSDGTTVTINPTQAVTFGGISYPAGQDFTVSLDRFETLQVQSTEDLTGSRITSSHPVSVLSGNLFTVVGNNQQGSGDHIVEMIPPVDTWGKEFVTAPLAKRTAGDIFRIVAARDNTQVGSIRLDQQVTVAGRTPRNLNAGEFWEFEADSNEYLHVTSDEPVLLAQYSKTASADNTDTDPFLLIIPPVAQFEADYTFSTIDLLVTGTSTTHHVNLVIQSADIAGLLFDGQPLPGSTVWHPVPGTNYEATDLTISAGTHTASHASPIATFGLFSYGYTRLEAYGYPGGLRLAQISAPCTTTQTVTNDRVDNDCDGRVDEELLDGIDNDGDGLIDEDLASGECHLKKIKDSVLARLLTFSSLASLPGLEVLLLFNSEHSIGMSNFNLAKEFVAEALQCFNDRGVQVGIGYILYDCVPEKIISLGTYTSDNAVLPGIILNQMQYGGRKRTYLAIRYMKDTSNFRNGAARAAVILTNGVQTTGDQVAEADLARNAGIELYSVAIGRSNFVDSIALDDIAGSATNVFDTSDPCALANRILDDLSCSKYIQ